MGEIVKRNPDEWETAIERYDKKATAEIGRKSVVFSYANTMLYEHSEPFRQFDHVYRVNDTGKKGVYYMRDDFAKLWDVLVENEYPRLIKPFPTVQDEQMVETFNNRKLHEGLEKLIKESE